MGDIRYNLCLSWYCKQYLIVFLFQMIRVGLWLLIGVYIAVTQLGCTYSKVLQLDSDEWDHFVYAQSWPPSMCLDPNPVSSLGGEIIPD